MQLEPPCVNCGFAPSCKLVRCSVCSSLRPVELATDEAKARYAGFTGPNAVALWKRAAGAP